MGQVALSRSVRATHVPPAEEANVGYLAGTIIAYAVVSGLILVAVIYAQHELHAPASRPAPVCAAAQLRLVVAGCEAEDF